MTEDWVKIFLPEGMLNHFEVTKVETENGVMIHLDELNHPPGLNCTSKGFFDSVKIQDFPIRGKAAFLVIRRRKWVNSTGQVVKNHWDLTAKGTRMTQELAAFLKGTYRQHTY